MINSVNFARIASICVGFHLGTFHCYCFHQDFWPNLNFPLEYQIKLVLITIPVSLQVTCFLSLNFIISLHLSLATGSYLTPCFNFFLTTSFIEFCVCGFARSFARLLHCLFLVNILYTFDAVIRFSLSSSHFLQLRCFTVSFSNITASGRETRRDSMTDFDFHLNCTGQNFLSNSIKTMADPLILLTKMNSTAIMTRLRTNLPLLQN